MNYLHRNFRLNKGDIVVVTLDGQANVRLLDNTNYQKYRAGQRHKYYGGLAKVSPVRLAAPHAGHWHVVVDLGGYPGTVRAGISVSRG